MHILVTVQLVGNGSAKKRKIVIYKTSIIILSVRLSPNCICNTNLWLSGYDCTYFISLEISSHPSSLSPLFLSSAPHTHVGFLPLPLPPPERVTAIYVSIVLFMCVK
jgi:hypothetical protein